MKKNIILLFILVFIQLPGYCFIWDSMLSNEERAGYLYDTLQKRYKTALAVEDIKTLEKIYRNLSWVSFLDKSRSDDVVIFKETIIQKSDALQELKLTRARGHVKNNYYITAAMEYVSILRYDSLNKEAKDYLKQHQDKIDAYIAAKKELAIKSVEEERYLDGEFNLRKLEMLDAVDGDAKKLYRQIERGKVMKYDRHLSLARIALEKEEYNGAMTEAKTALKYKPGSQEANEVYFEAYNLIRLDKAKRDSARRKYYARKNERKKSVQTDQGVMKYYNDASYYFNNGDLSSAKKSIVKYRSLQNDEKGRKLQQSIEQKIEEEIAQIMPKAVAFYNSQEYDKGLELFNQILMLDPGRDDAREYKGRIERRLKAFE